MNSIKFAFLIMAGCHVKNDNGNIKHRENKNYRVCVLSNGVLKIAVIIFDLCGQYKNGNI